jgi:hypothetical protein
MVDASSLYPGLAPTDPTALAPLTPAPTAGTGFGAAAVPAEALSIDHVTMPSADTPVSPALGVSIVAADGGVGAETGSSNTTSSKLKKKNPLHKMQKMMGRKNKKKNEGEAGAGGGALALAVGSPAAPSVAKRLA